MPINRAQLLADIKFWLPDSNVLTDPQIEAIMELVISQVGDDEANYAEVLCKSLKACALANKAKYSVDDATKKREEVGQVEVEYFEGANQDPWGKFLDSLKDICPIFGYNPPSTIGMKIYGGVKPTACDNDCTSSTDLYL